MSKIVQYFISLHIEIDWGVACLVFNILHFEPNKLLATEHSTLFFTVKSAILTCDWEAGSLTVGGIHNDMARIIGTPPI